MVQREVSKIDPRIKKVTVVETSKEPSIVVDPDPEEMLPTILLSWVMAKYSRRTQKSKMPPTNRVCEGDSFTLGMAPDPYVQQTYTTQKTLVLVTTTIV